MSSSDSAPVIGHSGSHTFQLDTSGIVYGVFRADVHAHADMMFRDLNAFTQGYVEALLRDFFEPSLPNISACGFSDLAPETLATIIRDCAGLSNILIGCVMGGDVARGRVAWHWRQDETADPRSPAQKLHDQFPRLTPTLGDDGKVRFQ